MKELDEIWKDIPGFEGYYQVSSIGKVKSLDRYVNYKNSGRALRKGKLLNLKVSDKGYLEVVLTINGNSYYKRVHQLVALAFIPNPNNYPHINHINEIKTDNRVENLEWCTPRQNKEAYTSSRYTIYQYDLKGNLIKKWNSVTRAAESVHGDKTGIYHCYTNPLKTYKGFIWTNVPLNKEELEERISNNNLIKVEQLDLEGNILHIFNSISEAAKAVNCNPSAISMACSGLRKTIKGYIWKKN